MQLKSNNVVDAVNELIAAGYQRDYRLTDGELRDLKSGDSVKIDDFHVDHSFRFETAPGSGDGANLYAISSRTNESKGLLIDAFDIVDDERNENALKLLGATATPPIFDNSADAQTKYGVRKVFKEEFNAAPKRYVLRKGFPDFPKCPFGQEFTMLGYDTQSHEYVWLVTSIIRDSRLQMETHDNLGR